MILREGRCSSRAASPSRTRRCVLSRYVHAVGVRTGPARAASRSSREYGSIPVVNMLTADHHPCQALADLQTLRERFGAHGRAEARLRGRRQQRRPLAGDRSARRAWSVAVATAAPDGYQLEPRGGRAAHRRSARGGRRARTRLHRRVGEHGRRGRRPTRAGPRSRPTASTTRCWPRRRPARSRCTACRPTRARRSPRPCCTASASASGTRRRTVATRRRRCSSFSSARVA